MPGPVLSLLLLFIPVELGYLISKKKGFKAPSLLAGAILFTWYSILSSLGVVASDLKVVVFLATLFLVLVGVIQCKERCFDSKD